MDFPPNSHKAAAGKSPKAGPKPKSKPEKKVEKVVTTEVIQRKKPLGRRFKDIFLGADVKGASSYIVTDVLFPAVRNMVVDATTKGIERFVYGDTSPRGRPTAQRPRTPYNAPVNRGRSNMLPGQPPRFPRQDRLPGTSEIIMSSLEEAEMVLEGLRDVIDTYEVVSIADYHSLVGLPTTFVENKWGWTNLSYADIQQTREGFFIDLPNPEPID